MAIAGDYRSSGLVVPIVLWGRKCPHNAISHVSCLQNGRIIVTGTTDGQIVQWIVDEALGWIQPQMMMLAHEAPICCIAPVSHSPSSTRYLTCSEEGHICLWDSTDGRVVESVRGNYVHRKIVPHSVNSSTAPSSTVLFCIGDYAEIAVMDSQDLNILFWLSSRVEADWIRTMTIVHPQDKHDVLIGVSVSGMIKLWSLNDIDKREPGHVIYEDESKSMTSCNVQFISCSNLNTRMMLVICTNSWQVIDPSNLKQLIISECAIEGVQGIIIDVDRVAIGFADSTIVLFQLPRSKLVGKQVREKFGDNPQNIGNIDQPFVFALVKGNSVPPSIPLWSTVQFHFDTRINAEGRRRRVAYRVDQQGSLSVWHIPKNYDLLVNEFIRSRRPVVYEPTMKQSFSDVWHRLNPHPPTLSGTEEDTLITATIYVGHQGKLFFGREDGSIIMTNACHAIMLQLLESATTENLPVRVLCGHSAAVNCFLYPYEESPRYDSQMLLSGGADFAVVVWSITTGTKLHRFCCQGGPVLRMLVPPPNSNPRILHTICAIAGDNSASLLSLKENKCVLLASRQQFPIVDVRWRPLDDFMLLRCEDDSVYVWEIETSNLDRIVTGLVTEDVMEACKEQIGLADVEDEAGASQAVQMFRAIKNKNVAAMKKIATHVDDKSAGADMLSQSSGLLPPMDVVQLKKCSDQTHLILFNVDNLITGLLSMDYELASHSAHAGDQNSIENKPSLSTLISKKADHHSHQNHHLPNPMNNSIGHHPSSISPKSVHSTPPIVGGGPGTLIQRGHSTESSSQQQFSNLYMDTARLLISLLHAWNVDESVDPVCVKTLKLLKPRLPICYGAISRKGHISLYMPYCTGKLPALNDLSYLNFSKNIRWQENKALTTIHLLSVIALSNTLMSFRSKSLHLTSKRPALRRVSSTKSTDSEAEHQSQQVKQGWSNVAALHCVLLPDLIKPPSVYSSPRIDLLARRWQDNCIEIRDAAQALLIREMDRLGPQGRRRLMETWGLFLPTLLDPTLSIFGPKLSSTSASYTPPSQNTPSHPQPPSQFIVSNANSSVTPPVKSVPPPKPPPPVPPRQPNTNAHLPVLASAGTSLPAADSTSKTSISSETNSSNHQLSIGASGNSTVHSNNNAGHDANSLTNSDRQIVNPLMGVTVEDNDKSGGIHQVRRNQATAIIVLGVMGAEFSADMSTNVDLVRATALSLLELLMAGESPLLPLNSPLRRAAIDLLGRGFAVWQPHLDISKVLLGLLDLAAAGDKYLPHGELFGAPLSPAADACRTARHSLSLIASARPQALITALSMEVARYNSAAQHQTIQHAVISPLMKSRNEVLRLIEQLSDKQYNCVADLIVPVGDILVHCLDTSLLKQRTLAEVFPPIAKFYMVGYCSTTRRIAFGGKTGAIVVHELRASKAQTIPAHNSPITALAFSQDGKYLAAYASQDAKISFWQTQQSFLGLTASQIKCVKTLPAPSEFPVVSPGGSYQQFRARLVWINAKSLTLMLPNGKENRFSV